MRKENGTRANLAEETMAELEVTGTGLGHMYRHTQSPQGGTWPSEFPKCPSLVQRSGRHVSASCRGGSSGARNLVPAYRYLVYYVGPDCPLLGLSLTLDSPGPYLKEQMDDGHLHR